MSHRFDPARSYKLDEPARKKILDPEKVLDLLNIEPGLTVADIGCGTGYFTIPLARRVGAAGRIVALDISGEMLAQTRNRAAASGLDNVETLLCQGSPVFPLADRSVDRSLLANVLHEVESPEDLLAEVARVTRDDGRLVVVEWKPVESPDGPPRGHRLPPERVLDLVRGSGFDAPAPHDAGPYHYAVAAVLRCRRSPA